MRWSLMLLLALGGCAAGTATGATTGRRATLPVTSLRAHDQGAIDHEGVGLVAGIITWDSAHRYKDAMVVVHWLESNERMPTSRAGSVGRVGVVAERWGEVPIVPMPTFVVGIANRTNHAVRIAPGQLELVDGEGGHFAPFADLGSITGRVEDQLTGSYRGLLGAPGIRESLHAKLGTIRLFTAPVEIPAGGDWVGYVAFQMPLLSPAEFAQYVERVGRVELHFTDDRGMVQLGFDKVVAGLQVTCPDDEKATLERCPPGGAMPKPSPQGP